MEGIQFFDSMILQKVLIEKRDKIKQVRARGNLVLTFYKPAPNSAWLRRSVDDDSWIAFFMCFLLRQKLLLVAL